MADASQQPLRLLPLTLAVLPPHPLLSNTSEITFVDFATNILNDGFSLTDSVMKNEFQPKGKPHTSSPSTAGVQLIVYDRVQTPSGRTENWFGRRSIHEDSAIDGSASFSEFESGLFDDHTIHEGQYTPDIFDTRQVLAYSAAEGLDAAALREKGWEDVHAEIFEVGHRIPGPLLSNRVFAIFVLRAKLRKDKFVPGEALGLTDPNGFLTVQIPVDLADTKAAFYSNGRNRSEGKTSEEKAKIVIGEYISVERVKKQTDGKIVWEMATASDAKGNIPLSLQKMGVPGAVIKDVGYFLKWTQEQRTKGGK